MNIVICDDNMEDAKKLYCCLKKEDLLNTWNIEICSCKENVLSILNTKTVQLLFMDIELEDDNGIDTAMEVRKKNEDILLVFYTNYEQYVFDSLPCGVFDFLRKPIVQSRLSALMKRAENSVRKKYGFITVQSKTGLTKILLSNLIYIEGYHRKLTWYTTQGTYESIGKLNIVENQIEDYGFLRCHQGFLVNMAFIQRITDREIVTSTDLHIEISVRKKQECLQTFNKYLLRNSL